MDQPRLNFTQNSLRQIYHYSSLVNQMIPRNPPTMNSLAPKRGFQVELQTNPKLPAKINIDGKMYTAPKTLTLAPGMHHFSAVTNIPDPNAPYVTYTFQFWMVNGTTVSSMATTMLQIIGDSTITAQYALGESGWGAPAAPDSLPNPNGPITPSLVLRNAKPNYPIQEV